MDKQTAQTLCRITSDFYDRQWPSFSNTRQDPWDGWKRSFDAVKGTLLSTQEKLLVLDLACGNLRYEHFLQDVLPSACIEAYAVDNCEDLVPHKSSQPQTNQDSQEPFGLTVHFKNLDIMEAILEGKTLSSELEVPLCNLSVCFGFLHHVPGRERQEQVLKALAQKTLPGGFIIVTFWRFMEHDGLANKATTTHAQALKELAALGHKLDTDELADNDLLLGWKDTPGVYRYAHSFTDAEIDVLVESLSNTVQVVDRFNSDGRSDSLNTYLVLRI